MTAVDRDRVVMAIERECQRRGVGVLEFLTQLHDEVLEPADGPPADGEVGPEPAGLAPESATERPRPSAGDVAVDVSGLLPEGDNLVIESRDTHPTGIDPKERIEQELLPAGALDAWSLEDKYATVHNTLRQIWVLCERNQNPFPKHIAKMARETLDSVDRRFTRTTDREFCGREFGRGGSQTDRVRCTRLAGHPGICQHDADPRLQTRPAFRGGMPWAGEVICPDCQVERADYEGPGKYLPTCPNCGSAAEPEAVLPPSSVNNWWCKRCIAWHPKGYLCAEWHDGASCPPSHPQSLPPFPCKHPSHYTGQPAGSASTAYDCTICGEGPTSPFRLCDAHIEDLNRATRGDLETAPVNASDTVSGYLNQQAVCPTCGSKVRVEMSDEGTSYYVPETRWASAFKEAFDLLYSVQWVGADDGRSARRLDRKWTERVGEFCAQWEHVARGVQESDA